MPNTAAAGVRPTDPDPEPDRPSDPGQYVLRLFTSCGNRPPDRGLWRTLVDFACGTRGEFIIQPPPRTAKTGQVVTCTPRSVPAHYVVLAAYHIYFLSDSAGVAGTDLERWAIPTMARQCRISKRYMTDALLICQALRIVRRIRDSRRKPFRYAMNAGGMTFATLRARVERASSGSTLDPLSGSRVDPRKGYVRKGYVQTPLFAAASSREAPPRNEEQQQQRRPENSIATENERRRLEGLIGAIAARSRNVGEPYDEADTRRRIAAGETTIDDLQHHADRLATRRRANDTRRPHQITATLDAGGRCTVCGVRRPDPAGYCPGPRA